MGAAELPMILLELLLTAFKARVCLIVYLLEQLQVEMFKHISLKK